MFPTFLCNLKIIYWFSKINLTVPNNFIDMSNQINVNCKRCVFKKADFTVEIVFIFNNYKKTFLGWAYLNNSIINRL